MFIALYFMLLSQLSLTDIIKKGALFLFKFCYFFTLYQVWVINEKANENMPDIPRFAPFSGGGPPNPPFFSRALRALGFASLRSAKGSLRSPSLQFSGFFTKPYWKD